MEAAAADGVDIVLMLRRPWRRRRGVLLQDGVAAGAYNAMDKIMSSMPALCLEQGAGIAHAG
jgi:hypothetical protein